MNNDKHDAQHDTSIQKQLVEAVKTNCIETVSSLLNRLDHGTGISPDILHEPLGAAIVSGDVKIVRLFKSHGAFNGWNIRSNIEATIKNGNVEMLRFLLPEISGFRLFGWEYFRYAIREKQREAVRVILAHGFFRHPERLSKPTVEASSDSQKLMDSLRSGDVENTQRFLDNHLRLQYVVHENGDDDDAVMLHGRFDEFMRHRSSLDYGDIHELTMETDSEMIDWLCESGEYFDWNETDRYTNILYWATTRHEYDIVERILRRGLSPNVTTSEGITPMHNAAETGNLEIFRLLEQYGGDINIPEIPELKGSSWWLCPDPEEAFRDEIRSNDFGETPLHTASDNNQVEIIGYLLKKGIDIESMDMMNRTPLFFACRSGSEDAVEMLLANGASVHARDRQDRTPLYEAAKRSNARIVELLLKNGADPLLTTKERCTAFHASVNHGSWQVLQMLLNHTPYDSNNDDMRNLLHEAAWKNEWRVVETFRPFLREFPLHNLHRFGKII